MNRFLDKAYIIRSEINKELPLTDGTYISLNLYQHIEEVFVLTKNCTECGENEYIVLDAYKYPNIALVSNISGLSLDQYIKYGAEIIVKSFVFTTLNDVRIQMVFSASKYCVPDEHILLATDNLLNSNSYIKLKEYFFEEFSEKYI